MKNQLNITVLQSGITCKCTTLSSNLNKRVQSAIAQPLIRCALYSALWFIILFSLFLLIVPVVTFDTPLSTVIYDRHGYLLGALTSSDEQWRFGVGNQIPEKFRIALTTFEDKRFFRHPGIDITALVRAAVLNLHAHRIVSGGSTITMQVVRLSRPGQPRSIGQKLLEMTLALRLELSLNKDEILALHAAYAPFGGNVIGLEAAAWRYFGCAPDNLSWAEAATLAVLPNAPSLIHPGRNRELLFAKRNRLLDRLHRTGHLDSLSCHLARLEPLPERPVPLPSLAPHLLARVKTQLSSKQQNTQARYQTTLDNEMQLHATRVIHRHHEQLKENGIYNAAAIIAEVNSGNVIVYVGNLSPFSDPGHGNWIDLITAPRSSGSILKPFLFGCMLESGEIMPGELLPDIPTRFGSFAPENFTRTFAGAIPAKKALAQSLNIPATLMLQSYGTDRFHDRLKTLGMTTLNRSADDYGLTLILGGAEATLWDAVGMYAALARTVNQHSCNANPGSSIRPLTYTMESPDLIDSPTHPLSAGACYELLNALVEVSRPGVDKVWRNFTSSSKIAWKTGTSIGHRDAWALGVTPQYAIGVWAGNADGEGRPNLTGHSAAAPILFELFSLLPTSNWFPQPSSEMTTVTICTASGMRANPNCGRTEPAVVPRSVMPGHMCRYCQLVHCDNSESWQVHADCELLSAINTVSWFVLPPIMEFYYKAKHPNYLPLPPYRLDCQNTIGETRSSSIACIYPQNNSSIYLPIGLNGQRGKTVFKASHRRRQARLFWHLDDTYCGDTRNIHQMELAPAPGKHLLTLVDEAGESLQRQFVVLGTE